jgi:hypothetical protein
VLALSLRRDDRLATHPVRVGGVTEIEVATLGGDEIGHPPSLM